MQQRRAREVTRPWYVEVQPTLLRGAAVETNADVYYDPNQRKTIGASVYVPFRFADRWLAAAHGSLWVARDAIR